VARTTQRLIPSLRSIVLQDHEHKTIMNSPSWNLSRYVRATIICNDLPVNENTAIVERIDEIAGNLAENGHEEITGYDTTTVRMIPLDESVKSPYPAEL
jgi:hypothetical protein